MTKVLNQTIIKLVQINGTEKTLSFCGVPTTTVVTDHS